MDLLWPKPPLTCSSHQTSTLGPLSLVVAACVKDARPSRWLAPLERPRRTQHRPRVAPPAKPSRLAVESVELVGAGEEFWVGDHAPGRGGAAKVENEDCCESPCK